MRKYLGVMNAIMNDSKRGDGEACDISVYDVRKCFDSLWMQECINDLYENGLTSDKLCMIYYSNINANIAINIQVDCLKDLPFTIKSCKELYGRD